MTLHAQIAAPNRSGVAIGHVHFTVQDPAANKRFWTAVGGVPERSSQHLHYYLREGVERAAKAWYLKMFGGTPGRRLRYEAVDLPGIRFATPFAKQANGVATAFLTDPWGARIELTEGLRRR